MTRTDTEQIAHELRDLVGLLRRRALAEPGDETIPFSLRTLMQRIELDGPATTADLARAERVTPQSAGALVAKLEAAGWVTRRDDATDGRRQLVVLTASGRKAIAARHAQRRTWLAGVITERLSPAEQRTLAAALPLLRKIAEPSRREP